MRSEEELVWLLLILSLCSPSGSRKGERLHAQPPTKPIPSDGSEASIVMSGMRLGKGTTGIYKSNRKGRCLGKKEPSSHAETRTVTEITQEDGWEREESITASQTGESAEIGGKKDRT